MTFTKFLVCIFYYWLILDYFVYGRISNERKCADAKCSVPVSLATTLIRYNADDDRLLSFRANSKAKIFSKEAGDKPTFWEAEDDDDIPNQCVNENFIELVQHFIEVCPSAINGKRGYVPKSLLRENKLLISKEKVNMVVSTGRDDQLKQNLTEDTLEERNLKPANIVKTPELTSANSKGLFSTIGGVSADSVPPNSPDINPQSTRPAYEVSEGTTIYKDFIPSANIPNVMKEESKDTEPKSVKKQSSEEDSTTTLKPDVVTGEIDDKGHNQLPEIKEGNANDLIENIQSDVNTKMSSPIHATSSIIPGFLSNLISSGSEENEVKKGIEDEDSSIEKNIEKQQEKVRIDETTAEENTVQDIKDDEIKSVSLNNATLSNGIFGSNDSKEGKGTLQEEEGPNDKTTAAESTVEEITDSANTQADLLNNASSNDSIISDNLKQDIAQATVTQPATTPTEGIGENDSKTKLEGVSNAASFVDISNIEHDIDSKEDILSDNTVQNISHKESFDHYETSTLPQGNEDKNNVNQESKENEFHSKFDNNISETAGSTFTIDTKQNNIEKTVEESDHSTLHSGPSETTQRDDLNNTQATQESVTKELQSVNLNDIDKNDESQELEITHKDTLSSELEKKDSSTVLSTENILDNETTLEIVQNTSYDNPSPEINLSETTVLDNNIEPLSTTIEKTNEEFTKPEDLKSKILHKQTDNSIHSDGSFTPDTNVPSYQSAFVGQPTEYPSSSLDKDKLNIFNEEVAVSDRNGIDRIVSLDSLEAKETQGTTEIKETLPQDSPFMPVENLPPNVELNAVEENVKIETTENETSEGMFSWVEQILSLFSSSSSSEKVDSVEWSATDEPQRADSMSISYNKDESCLADGVGEEACETLQDASSVPVQTDVSWQEQPLYPAEIAATLDLLSKIPVEITIWLIITAVVVLVFSLGHYYIEAHRRDGPLVAIINKLEREVLILRKESSILEDRLQTAQDQLEAWNCNSSENDALIVELKQELEETKVAKVELEEQVAVLEREVETVTESGLEMHRLLSESLSSQDGSQVLLSTVETLREKLDHQEDEISNLNLKLSQKNAEIEELKEKLSQSAVVSSSLEEKVISISREKEEEALELKDKHRQLIEQLEEVMETKALDETRVSTEMSKLRLFIEELQKTMAEKDLEIEELREVVKQVRSTDSNEKMDALFDVVGFRAQLKAAVTERDDFREKFQEEEGARKLLEGHMKKISQEVADLKNSFETAEKEKIEALTKLQVLSNYFKEKESQLQKELGLQESMWLQKQSNDHTIYEQMRSLREENEKYKLQNESLKKEIVEQESSFKIQVANVEQKSHENWVASRQAERRLKEVQQEAAQLRNRLTMEKNTASYSLDEGKHNISESNGDPSSSPPSLMFPSTRSPPFMMYPPMPPPGDFVPPPPLMGSPYPSDSRPPPLGRISSPPLDHRFSPPPPMYPPYDYPPYGHHSPSPPPPLPPTHSHHRNVHKPQPREMPREQKDHSNYSPEAEKAIRRNKR